LILDENSFSMKIIAFQQRCKTKLISFIILILFIIQGIFWFQTEKIKPNLGIVPDLPSKYSSKVLSFGDTEFYFRTKAMRIQNAGDTFGRVTPLKNYDYEKLYRWFSFLDTLNSRSNYIPALASYYYSNSQNKMDTIPVIRYLEERYDLNPEKNWWWMYQAIFMAAYKLQDEKLALRLSYKLRDTSGNNTPIWTKQVAALMHSKFGEHCEAIRVINEILQDYENKKINVDDNEINFMLFFIKNRIASMKKEGFDIKQCSETQKAQKFLNMKDEKEYQNPMFEMQKE